MSDKFGEGRDPYLYPGLNVMRNRLGDSSGPATGASGIRNDRAPRRHD